MPKANPKVDAFISNEKKWKEEFKKLRSIALSFDDLSEDLKWGVPCYTWQNKNVLLIHGFKEYCAILFVKGALLKDPHHVMITQTENVQAARQIRFTSLEDVVKVEPIVREYITEAIDAEKAGRKVEFKPTEDFNLPAEFQKRLDEMPALKTAFEALTPGRQRAYLLFFSQPKQSTTREARVEKSIGSILKGKGLND